MQIVTCIPKQQRLCRQYFRHEPLDRDARIDDEETHRSRSSRSSAVLSQKTLSDAASRSRIASTPVHELLEEPPMASARICLASLSTVLPCDAARAPSRLRRPVSRSEITNWLMRTPFYIWSLRTT